MIIHALNNTSVLVLTALNSLCPYLNNMANLQRWGSTALLFSRLVHFCGASSNGTGSNYMDCCHPNSCFLISTTQPLWCSCDLPTVFHLGVFTKLSLTSKIPIELTTQCLTYSLSPHFILSVSANVFASMLLLFLHNPTHFPV